MLAPYPRCVSHFFVDAVFFQHIESYNVCIMRVWGNGGIADTGEFADTPAGQAVVPARAVEIGDTVSANSPGGFRGHHSANYHYFIHSFADFFPNDRVFAA
jgi:hypothetical protein